MAIKRIRHRGEAPRDVDLGPASGAHIGHATAQSQVAALSAFSTASLSVGGGSGRVERRQASEAQREAWQRQDEPSPIAPVQIRAKEPPVSSSTPLPTVQEADDRPWTTPELVLPCDGCVHVPVCAIRLSFDPLAFRLVTVEDLWEEGLHVRATVDLECDHRLELGDPAAPRRIQPARARQAREPRTSALSPRQSEAIRLVSAGHTRAEAARQMSTTYQTVDGLLEAAGKKGLLPAELIAKLPARFARYHVESA